MASAFELDAQTPRRDWEAVGDNLLAAMQEVATDLGGEGFAAHIVNLAASDEVLPNPAALKFLDDSFPGSADRALTRCSEIQLEAQQRELVALHRPRARRYGRAILDGFARMNIFGMPLRRH